MDEAAKLLVKAYAVSGVPTEHVQEVLAAAEAGDAVACRALVADVSRLAVTLPEGHALLPGLFALAQKFEAHALQSERKRAALQ